MTISTTTTTSPTSLDPSGLVFSRLILPLPLDPGLVTAFLRRLAAERHPHRVVLETVATPEGIAHLIGTEATRIRQVRRILTDLIPGIVMTGLDSLQRPALVSAGYVTFRPALLPLSPESGVAAARSLYSTLAARLHADEAITLQVVLGRGIHPAHTPTHLADPRPIGLWAALTMGTATAPTELRNHIRDRQADYGLTATLRIGVAGSDPARRGRFVMDVLAAISLLEGPGVQASVRRERPGRLKRGVLRRPLRLAVPELAGLIGWPIGPDPLPGLPPSHPKLLRLDPATRATSGVFARSLVPGDTRPISLAPSDSGMHGILVGPTGVGKSTALEHIILGAVEDGDAVAVIDPKGESPERLRARIPRERWADIREIDGAVEEPLGFNPLDATGRDTDVVADGILAVFARLFANGWGPRTADIFSASIRTLIRGSDPGSPSTLLDLPRLWTDDRFRRRMVGAVAEDPGIAGFWAWFDAMTPSQRLSTLAAPMNKLRQVLLKPAAVKILGQPNPGFRLRDVFRDQLIVILPTNPALMGEETAHLISALAIAELWQAVQERVAEPGKEKRQGHVFVDEADRLMHLPVSLGDALARSRSMNVSWMLAVQGWFQMPPEMQKAAKTNARTKLIFRAEDDEEARTVARLAPELDALDFMALGKFQAYLKLVVDGMPRDWALVETLPPDPALFDPREVLAASRQACPPAAVPLPPASASARIRSTPTSEPTPDVSVAPTADAAPEDSAEVFGRRRRQR